MAGVFRNTSGSGKIKTKSVFRRSVGEEIVQDKKCSSAGHLTTQPSFQGDEGMLRRTPMG